MQVAPQQVGQHSQAVCKQQVGATQPGAQCAANLLARQAQAHQSLCVAAAPLGGLVPETPAHSLTRTSTLCHMLSPDWQHRKPSDDQLPAGMAPATALLTQSSTAAHPSLVQHLRRMSQSPHHPPMIGEPLAALEMGNQCGGHASRWRYAGVCGAPCVDASCPTLHTHSMQC